VFDQSEQQAIN